MLFYNNLQSSKDRRFPLIHHYEMLRDHNRINSYYKAINETINEKDVVVDIGTGTGILSHFAKLKTSKEIFAIEYNEPTLDFAQQICKLNEVENIKFIKGRSYDVDISNDRPTVLLTETIGPFGPEENIVEICYDFVKRHPSISTIIPLNLTLYGCEFYSETLENNFEQIVKSFDFSNYGCSTFSVKNLKKFLEQEYCSLLQMGLLDDVIFYGDKSIIKQYILGVTPNSDFTSELFINDKRSNGIYLFFDSQLSENIKLSNEPNSEFGHWYPLFVKKPIDAVQLNVAYSYKERTLKINWK